MQEVLVGIQPKSVMRTLFYKACKKAYSISIYGWQPLLKAKQMSQEKPRPENISVDKSKVLKSDQEWMSCLTPEQFRVTRQHGTERAFTGPYWNEKRAGLYRCVCCNAALFRSTTKYDSGTGWPSFWEPVSETAVEERSDNTHGMRRTEICCASCHAHLGHVFEDGPPPSGLRYCMNGTALRLELDDEGTDKAGQA